MQARKMRELTLAGKKFDIAWLLLVLLASMNFMNLGPYLLIAAAGIMLILRITAIQVDVSAVFLCLFSVSYYLIYRYYYISSETELVNYLIMPWCVYLMGYLFVRGSALKHPLAVFISVISFGFLVHGVLNLMSFILFHQGDHASYSRICFDFWQQKDVSVTACGMYFIMAIGVGCALLTTRISTKRKLIALLMIAVGIYNSVIFAHRTYIIILLITLLTALIVWLFDRRVSSNKKLIVGMTVAALALIFAVFLVTDALGIRSAIVATKLYRRLFIPSEVNSDSRFVLWSSFFSQWLHYPLGGQRIALYGDYTWVHNMWLDVYNKAGMIPFIFLILAFVCIIYQMASLYQYMYKIESEKISAKILLFFYIAVLANFMCEPIIDANPYYFLLFTAAAGGVSASIQRYREESSL